MPDDRYLVLAKNLFNAWMAYRTGTTVATQERKDDREHMGSFWLDLAERFDREAMDQMEAFFDKPAPKGPLQ